MFEITVEQTFCAAHAIHICGQREPIHGHNWHVIARIRGKTLDDDGLLCDFHKVERALGEICEPFINQNLNEVEPFDRVNPTAEHIARHIAIELHDRLGGVLAPHARVAEVSISEAPGCRAACTIGED